MGRLTKKRTGAFYLTNLLLTVVLFVVLYLLIDGKVLTGRYTTLITLVCVNVILAVSLNRYPGPAGAGPRRLHAGGGLRLRALYQKRRHGPADFLPDLPGAGRPAGRPVRRNHRHPGPAAAGGLPGYHHPGLRGNHSGAGQRRFPQAHHQRRHGLGRHPHPVQPPHQPRRPVRLRLYHYGPGDRDQLLLWPVPPWPGGHRHPGG